MGALWSPHAETDDYYSVENYIMYKSMHSFWIGFHLNRPFLAYRIPHSGMGSRNNEIRKSRTHRAAEMSKICL